MSAVNDLVSELVRAANELDLLTGLEKRRLLERSITVIRDMQEKVGIPPSKTTAGRRRHDPGSACRAGYGDGD